jgi:long-subunit fatty acid transport protein
MFPVYIAASPVLEITSSFNPETPGALTIGKGGAVIASADNPFSAYWNPAGYMNMLQSEFAFDFVNLIRDENVMSENYSRTYSERVRDKAVNYLGFAYPLQIFDRNMVISVAYQNLYDFNRDWIIRFNKKGLENDLMLYTQSGNLSALGLSYCFQISPKLSAGITLNLWDDDISKNQWIQNYHTKIFIGKQQVIDDQKKEIYTFDGKSINLGFLWRINPLFHMGGIVRFAFTADINHQIIQKDPLMSTEVNTENLKESLQMPTSYAIGFSYKYSDQLFLSLDFYQTRWDTFIYTKQNGDEINPLNGEYINRSKTKPTFQVRSGIEYRYINREKEYIIPLRAGFFYDPAPSSRSPDTILGFSLGSGLTYKKISFDIAYQFRYGNDVGEDLFNHLNFDFSEDLREHKIYAGMIIYTSAFFNPLN